MATIPEFGGLVSYKVKSNKTPYKLLSFVRPVIREVKKYFKWVGVPYFDVIGRLGAGSFGQTVLAQHSHSPREDKLVAVKRIRWRQNTKLKEVKHAVSELSTMIAVRNNAKIKDFCVEIFWAFVSNDCVNLVMEPAPYGHLKMLIMSRPKGRMEVDEARLHMADLAHALSLLHDMKISHGDIKPKNILVCANGRLKLCDFGLAIHHANEDEAANFQRRSRGTKGYMAPEKNVENPYIADWYSLGCVFFEMVTGIEYYVPKSVYCSCCGYTTEESELTVTDSSYSESNNEESDSYSSYSETYSDLSDVFDPTWRSDFASFESDSYLTDSGFEGTLCHEKHCEKCNMMQHSDCIMWLFNLMTNHNDLYQVIDGLTQHFPDERICFTGFWELKSHQFFASTCWDCVALRKCCGKSQCVSRAIPWQEIEVPSHMFVTIRSKNFDKSQCETDLNTVSEQLEITFKSKK